MKGSKKIFNGRFFKITIVCILIVLSIVLFYEFPIEKVSGCPGTYNSPNIKFGFIYELSTYRKGLKEIIKQKQSYPSGFDFGTPYGCSSGINYYFIPIEAVFIIIIVIIFNIFFLRNRKL